MTHIKYIGSENLLIHSSRHVCGTRKHISYNEIQRQNSFVPYRIIVKIEAKVVMSGRTRQYKSHAYFMLDMCSHHHQ